jgi:hypothetical protein
MDQARIAAGLSRDRTDHGVIVVIGQHGMAAGSLPWAHNVILGLVPRICRGTVLVQILGTSPRLSGLFCLQWRTALILLGLLNHPANRT